MAEVSKDSSKLSAADKALHLYERRSGAGIIAGAVVFLIVAVAGGVGIFVGVQGYRQPEFGLSESEAIRWIVGGVIIALFGVVGAVHHLLHRSDIRQIIGD